ncbi:hypothetical protein [Luteitalea sp.]|jgi:TolB-like protein
MTDHLPPSFLSPPSSAPAADTVPAAEAPPPAGTGKKKNKVRSAWIGFAGRVVAQLVGAAATVMLGYTVVSHTAKSAVAAAQATAPTPPRDRTSAVARATAGLAAASDPARHSGPTLVVLPFADYSPADTSTRLADGVTEAVTAALARSGRVSVISRTSARQYRESTRPLPVIAAELGVDVVVEGSLVRHGDRVRVTVQLIDAATDAHLWAQTYDRTARDVLDFEADISAAIDADLAGVLPRRLQATPAEAPSRAAF